MKERDLSKERENPSEHYKYVEEALRDVNRALAISAPIPRDRLFDAMQRMNVIMRGQEEFVLQQIREELLSSLDSKLFSRGALDMLEGIQALEHATTEEGVLAFELGDADIYVNSHQDGRIIPIWIEAEGRVAASFKMHNFRGPESMQLEQTAVDAQRL